MAAGDLNVEKLIAWDKFERLTTEWLETQRRWHCRIGKVTYKSTGFMSYPNFWKNPYFKLPPDASPAP